MTSTRSENSRFRWGPAAVPVSVPAQDRRGLDDDERLAPTRPVALEPDPEQAVRPRELRSTPFALVDRELMSERDDLDEQVRPGSSGHADSGEDREERFEHRRRVAGQSRRVKYDGRMGFSRTPGNQKGTCGQPARNLRNCGSIQHIIGSTTRAFIGMTPSSVVAPRLRDRVRCRAGVSRRLGDTPAAGAEPGAAGERRWHARCNHLLRNQDSAREDR